MSVETQNHPELFLKSIEDDAYIDISEICNQLQRGNILMQKRLEEQNQKRQKKNNKKVYKKTNVKQVEIIKTENDSRGEGEEIRIKKRRKEVQKVTVEQEDHEVELLNGRKPKAVSRQADIQDSDDLLNHDSPASDEDENSQEKAKKRFDPNSKEMKTLFDEIFAKVKDIQMKLADESLKKIIAEKTMSPYQKVAPLLEGAANQDRNKRKQPAKPKKKRRKMQIDDEE